MEIVERPEGKYAYVGGHFYIECKCGSGKGCHYKQDEPSGDVFDETSYNLDMKVRGDNAYYGDHLKESNLMHYTSIMVLESMITEAAFNDKLPLILVCDNCEGEFNLTPELFQEVVGRKIENLDLL